MIKRLKTEERQDKEMELNMVFLTLEGKHLNPEKISKDLNIIPEYRGKLGEPFGKNKKYKQGYWLIDGGLNRWKIETQMKHIIKKISPVKYKLQKLIKEDKTIERASLTIVLDLPEKVFNPCYYFSSDIINEFTALGIDIELSIHLKSKWDKFFAKKKAAH